jgi:hypothetical protein
VYRLSETTSPAMLPIRPKTWGWGDADSGGTTVEEDGLYGGGSSISSGSIKMGCDDDIVRSLLLFAELLSHDTNSEKTRQRAKQDISNGTSPGTVHVTSHLLRNSKAAGILARKGDQVRGCLPHVVRSPQRPT